MYSLLQSTLCIFIGPVPPALSCPTPSQFDALIERLTGQELLTMFARLRGIPEKHIREVVDTEIKRLDLTKYAKKLCGSYR